MPGTWPITPYSGHAPPGEPSHELPVTADGWGQGAMPCGSTAELMGHAPEEFGRSLHGPEYQVPGILVIPQHVTVSSKTWKMMRKTRASLRQVCTWVD